MTKWQSDSMRKMSRNISIPRCLDDIITTELVTQLIEENMDRILCGDVEKARMYRKALFAEQLARTMRKDKEALVITEDLEKSLDRIFEAGKKVDSELLSPLRQLEKMRKDVSSLVQELRAERNNHRKDKEKIIDEILSSLIADYDIISSVPAGGLGELEKKNDEVKDDEQGKE